MSQRPEISFIMPCYNEEEVIPYTIPQFVQAFKAAGHRLDLVTFVNYAGAVPGRPANQAWTDWDQAADRGWTAEILWQGYGSYFSTNHLPTP